MELTFFVLPTQALPWPNGSALTVVEAAEEAVPPFALRAGSPPTSPTEGWWVRLLFHHRRTKPRRDDEAFLLVDSVMKEQTHQGRLVNRPDLPWFSPDDHRETVVEITSSLDSDDREQLQVAINRGLEALRDADRAAILASGEARTPVAPADVWPVVPCLVRDQDGALIGLPRMIVLEGNELRDRPTRAEFDEEMMRRAEVALGAIQAHHPFIRWMEWLAAAEEARNTTRPEDAVLKLAVAVEVMLDAVLAIALWEVGTSVEEGSRILAAPLSKRVRRDFGPILGGSWDRTKGPVAAWATDLAFLRGRVVHRGHRPDEPELDAAFAAADQIHKHVVERVVDGRARLPKTAWSLVGPADLAERRAWDGGVRRLGADGGLASDDWLLRYGRWRTAVDLAVSDA